MPHIHLIGIGGAGLSAIATVLLQQGYTVSGSDAQAGPATERLQRLGAEVFIGQRAENIRPGIEVVVISSAIAADNPELVAARQQGLRVAKRAEWLGQMMAHSSGIAVAGTHGKTTTTAMIAFILRQAGLDPTYIIGGFVPQMETNAAAGSGPAFVIEADEYDHMFLGLRPQVAIITNVEWDHPDIFPTAPDMQRAFAQFAALVPATGRLIGCGDAPGVADALGGAPAPVTTYGLGASNHWRVQALQPNAAGCFDFALAPPDGPTLAASLAVPGQHNVLNGTAAIIAAQTQGVAPAQAAEILAGFCGVERRFQWKGEVNGITIIDDYAHHPTEIRATLAAARGRFGARPIWAAFQPHTFSRTHALLDDFAAAFGDADHVRVLDIFPSRERDTGLVHSRDIVARMRHPDARYAGPPADAAATLAAELRSPAVLLTLGAGDGYKVGEWLLERMTSDE
ncbi:MAG: UDP-N-acetylmuramate--L-alanine ligase [Anaerolineae bacterium]